jgi:hypothetical protein
VYHYYFPDPPAAPTAQENPMAVNHVPFEDGTAFISNAVVPLNGNPDAFLAPDSPAVNADIYDSDL